MALAYIEPFAPTSSYGCVQRAIAVKRIRAALSGASWLGWRCRKAHQLAGWWRLHQLPTLTPLRCLASPGASATPGSPQATMQLASSSRQVRQTDLFLLSAADAQLAAALDGRLLPAAVCCWTCCARLVAAEVAVCSSLAGGGCRMAL